MNRFTLHIAAVLFPASLLLGQIQLQPAFPSLSFSRPVDIQAPPDSSNRLAVVSQQGIIYIFPNSSSVQSAKVFLDIRDSAQSTGNEEGLLGLAFHPDFKNNRYIFVNHTGKNPRRDVVARYTVSAANPDSVVKSSRVSILEIYDPYENHNAGQIAFGPDGYLYIGTGDGGSSGDPQNRAQNPDSLLGKMLRIDVDNTDPGRNYAIPSTNPYYGMTSPRPEIWATGFRNPWRYSFDSFTGSLWVGDVGQNAREEIDIVEKGKNYGWRIMEGNQCYNPSTGCNPTGLSQPVWEYGHPPSGASITGGYVYRGSAIPELYSKYVYADFIFGSIWLLSYDSTAGVSNSLFANSGLNVSSFGVDENKELYLSAFDGKIYKFVKLSPPVAFFTISKSMVDFGNTKYSSVKTDSVQVKNTGTSTLNISSAVSNNPRFIVAPGSAAIVPGDSMKFFVVYTALDTGAIAGKVVFTHGAVKGKDTVNVSAYGQAGISSLNRSTMTIGPIAVNASKTDSVVVTNVGNFTLQVAGVVSIMPTVFSVSPMATMLGVGSNQKFIITATLDSAKQRKATIYFIHDGLNLLDSVSVTVNSLTGVATSDQPPPSFTLSQNFPNPFNPSTMIEFTVGTYGHTSLRVFNVLGQEVATLFNDVAEAGRAYELKFDASRLPSGLYFSKLDAGKQQAIRKMILLK